MKCVVDWIVATEQQKKEKSLPESCDVIGIRVLRTRAQASAHHSIPLSISFSRSQEPNQKRTQLNIIRKRTLHFTTVYDLRSMRLKINKNFRLLFYYYYSAFHNFKRTNFMIRHVTGPMNAMIRTEVIAASDLKIRFSGTLWPGRQQSHSRTAILSLTIIYNCLKFITSSNLDWISGCAQAHHFDGSHLKPLYFHSKKKNERTAFHRSINRRLCGHKRPRSRFRSFSNALGWEKCRWNENIMPGWSLVFLLHVRNEQKPLGQPLLW